MPANSNRTQPKRFADEAAECDRMRTAILAEIDKAVTIGWRIAPIGYVLVGDLSFVTRLRGEHRFRITTLVRAYTNLSKIKETPPAQVWVNTARMLLNQ